MLVTLEDNIEDFEQKIDRAWLAMSSAMHRAVEAAVDEGPREAIQTHHYQDQTGLLTGMTKGFVLARVPGGALGEFGAYTKYASFVDAGTAPHEIHGNPLLTFKGSSGQWVTVAMVHHPGTKPDGFMGRGYLKAEAVMIREVEIGAAEMQRELDQ
jgi:hypothetical protein